MNLKNYVTTLQVSHSLNYNDNLNRDSINLLSMLSAISIRKVEASMYLQDSANGEVFTHLLKHHLCPVLHNSHVVIMADVSFHKIEMATDLIGSKGARVLTCHLIILSLIPSKKCGLNSKVDEDISKPESYLILKSTLNRLFHKSLKLSYMDGFNMLDYRALFFGTAVTSTLNYISSFSDHEQKLREQDKPFNVAIIVAMRKLLTMLNSMMWRRTPWKKETPKFASLQT